MTQTTKLKARDFDLLCGGVQYAIDSLCSCRQNEVARETARLDRAVSELESAVLLRRNARLEDDRTRLLRRASELRASRKVFWRKLDIHGVPGLGWCGPDWKLAVQGDKDGTLVSKADRHGFVSYYLRTEG